MKVIKCVNSDGSNRGLLIMCPACGNGHMFNETWTFNGDMEKPTFRPSMLVRGYLDRDKSGEHRYGTCHSFVTDGRIEFLPDCTHEMAGQTVELLEVPEE